MKLLVLVAESRLVPVGDKVPYNYAKFKAGDAYYNCGWGHHCTAKRAIFLGFIDFRNNIQPNPPPNNPQWNILSYNRCIEYMETISKFCPGQGGTYETGYGFVSSSLGVIPDDLIYSRCKGKCHVHHWCLAYP